jgi:ubiquinone/menaquinone biosynthesis C-methylase UbiE
MRTPQPEQNWEAGYHTLYERGTERFKGIYANFYHAVYERAIMMVRERIADPLSKEKPNVLLCGTASSETTRNFVRFIQGKNNQSRIDVIDLNRQPLETSRAKLQADGTIDSSKVRYTQADALKMPFADGSIDLLETDFFLQFFSPKDKQRLIKEWARILSEDGAITTREFLPDNAISRIIDNIRRSIASRGKIDTYELSEDELVRLFQEAGLEADIVPFKFGPLKSHILKHIIAYKKSHGSNNRGMLPSVLHD